MEKMASMLRAFISSVDPRATAFTFHLTSLVAVLYVAKYIFITLRAAK